MVMFLRLLLESAS